MEGLQTDTDPKVEVFERDELLKVRWLVGCEELKEGTTRKSIIRQIFLPGEWLSSDDHEPEASRHGKEPRHSRAQAPAAAVPSSAGVHGDTPVKAKEKKEEESEHFAVQSGAKQSDGSTGVGSTFDTSSNSSKESNHEAKDSSNSSRNVINISNCIGSGDSSGKTISLNASISTPSRAPTAEEQATAALSAMLGLGKPKVPLAPTPPPRTHWAIGSSGSAVGYSPARSGLNPNAAEFRPMVELAPCEVSAPSESFPEMTNLLGVNLLDEICGGAEEGEAETPADEEEVPAKKQAT